MHGWVHIRLLQRSAHSALVELEHQRRADVVGERQHLLLTKHVLDQGEDALAGPRVGREGKGHARRRGPHGEAVSVGAPPLEDRIGVGLHVRLVKGTVSFPL